MQTEFFWIRISNGQKFSKMVISLPVNKIRVDFLSYLSITGDRGSTVVKVLCYKSEGRWFDPS